GRADGEGVATVPPAGDAAVPGAGEPDVAAIATPAPPSRATTATPARITGLPGSLRVPSMSERLPSGCRRGHRADGSKGHARHPSWALAEKVLRHPPAPWRGYPSAGDIRADIKLMIMTAGGVWDLYRRPLTTPMS